jgi:hypothetical protein
MGSQTAISRSNRITFSARCAQVSRFDGQLLCRDELGIEDADARNVELLSGNKGGEVGGEGGDSCRRNRINPTPNGLSRWAALPCSARRP